MSTPQPTPERVSRLERIGLRRRSVGGGRGAGLAVSDQVIVSGLNFAFLLLAGRYLTPTAFGAFAIFNTTVMLGMLVHASLVVTPMTLEAGSLKHVLRDTLWLHIVVTSVLCVLMLAAPLVVRAPSLYVPIRWSALALPFVLTGELLRRGEMARVRWTVVSWSDGIGLTVRLVGLVAVGWAASLSLPIAVALFAGGALISSVALVIIDRGSIGRAVAALAGSGRVSRRQGWQLLVGQLASWGNSQALMYVVGVSAGLAQVGALSASQVLLQPLNILLLGAGNWSLPYMTRLRAAVEVGEEHGATREILKQSDKLALSLGGIALAYGVVLLPLAPLILDLLYRGKYTDAVAFVALWAVAYVLSATARGLSTGLTALRRADVIATASVAGLPFIVILALFGRSLGAAMVPIGSSIGSVVQLAVMLVAGWQMRKGTVA